MKPLRKCEGAAMRELILDGRQIKTRADLHAALKVGLELPDYYGNNLDALWDMLTGHIGLPQMLRWTYFHRSQQLLAGYAQDAYALMKRAEREGTGFLVRKYRYGYTARG